MLLVAHATHAGQQCDEKPPSADALEIGLNLGVMVSDALDNSGGDVALIARSGQDLSKYGLQHSHMSFVVRDARNDNQQKSKWTVIHMLNLCGRSDSELFAEGLGMFFMDMPFRYEAMIAIPSEGIQARLKTILASDLPRRF